MSNVFLLSNEGHIAGFCALCAIQKHVSRALQSTGRILAPKYLVSNLRCILSKVIVISLYVSSVNDIAMSSIYVTGL